MEPAAPNLTLQPREVSEQLGPVHVENSDSPGRKETSRSPTPCFSNLAGMALSRQPVRTDSWGLPGVWGEA